MAAAQELGGVGTLLSARVRIPQSVVYRSFAHETVLLNLDTGLYHGVNPSGGRMLDTLAGLGSVEQAASVLAREYDVPLDEIRSDLCGFCEALVSRGLLAIESP
jgi:hypothetical protein